jgi:hypothetical protein
MTAQDLERMVTETFPELSSDQAHTISVRIPEAYLQNYPLQNYQPEASEARIPTGPIHGDIVDSEIGLAMYGSDGTWHTIDVGTPGQVLTRSNEGNLAWTEPSTRGQITYVDAGTYFDMGSGVTISGSTPITTGGWYTQSSPTITVNSTPLPKSLEEAIEQGADYYIAQGMLKTVTDQCKEEYHIKKVPTSPTHIRNLFSFK